MLFMQFIGLSSLTLIQASVKPFRSPKLNQIDISCLSIISLQFTTILSVNKSSVHVVTCCTASLTLLLLLGFVSLICYQALIKYSSFRWCPTIKKSQDKNRRLEPMDDDDDEPDEMRKALLRCDNNSN